MLALETSMQTPFLVRPCVEYQRSYVAAIYEYLAEGVRPPWNPEMIQQHFDEYVQTLLDRETDPLRGDVPQTDYWLIVDGAYCGDVNLRHHLTPELERYGGHIGYRIRPSMRRKGYGTLQCRLALEKARERGLERVLITCDDDNIGSSRIIEANGGVLLDRIDYGRAALVRRYWISIPQAGSLV
jgi:predicted acetyltransferase